MTNKCWNVWQVNVAASKEQSSVPVRLSCSVTVASMSLMFSSFTISPHFYIPGFLDDADSTFQEISPVPWTFFFTSTYHVIPSIFSLFSCVNFFFLLRFLSLMSSGVEEGEKFKLLCQLQLLELPPRLRVPSYYLWKRSYLFVGAILLCFYSFLCAKKIFF